jgi:hypothetical protein
MIASMGPLLGDKKLDERVAEIKAIIDRMDFRWDQGFITDKDSYLEQRVKLQQELEQLTPIADNDLETAADMLANFEHHWNAFADDPKAQQQLLQLIVGRVWVKGNRVVTLSLRPNYHVTVGLESTKLTELEVSFEDRNIVRNRRRRVLHPSHVSRICLWHPNQASAIFSCLVVIFLPEACTGRVPDTKVRDDDLEP